MNYNELDNYYYTLYQERLPFYENEIDWEKTHEARINRATMLLNVQTKYNIYLESHKRENERDIDYQHFFEAINNCTEEYVICLFAHVKGHLLMFIFDDSIKYLICVFPLQQWTKLVG